MSKERARRRAEREAEAAQLQAARARKQLRTARKQRTLAAVTAPARSAAGAGRTLWQPISGGQRGRLAQRRRRRFLAVTVIVVLVNIAVWTWQRDVGAVVASAAISAVTVPVLARVLFSRY